MLGVTLGFGVMIMAAGFGLAGLFQAEPRLHALLKYAGATYLVYLAWRIAQADAARRDLTRARPISFVEKSGCFYLGLFEGLGHCGGRAGGLHDPGRRRVVANLGDCRGVLAAACLASVVIWAAFGAAIGRLLRNPRARRTFNWTMAGLLVLSLIPVFLHRSGSTTDGGVVP